MNADFAGGPYGSSAWHGSGGLTCRKKSPNADLPPHAWRFYEIPRRCTGSSVPRPAGRGRGTAWQRGRVSPPPPPAEASSTLGHRPEFLVLGSAAGGGRQLRSPAEAQRHTKDPSYRSSFSPPKQLQGPVLRSASSPHPSQKHFSPFLPTCSNAPRL